MHPIVWATLHERYKQTDRQDTTGQERQRSDSIGQTVLQTVAQKLKPRLIPSCLTEQALFCLTRGPHGALEC